MKYLNCTLLLIFICCAALGQKRRSWILQSPDGKITVNITAEKDLMWSVKHEQTTVFLPSPLSVSLLGGDILGKNVAVINAKSSSVDQNISTPIYKKKAIHDQYSQILLNLKKNYGVVFRAYNDGVAYRFFTNRKDSSTVAAEEVRFNFEKDVNGLFPYVRDFRVRGDQYATSFEALYHEGTVSTLTKDTIAFLPVLVELDNGKKAVITESDLRNYPGMYITGGKGNDLHGSFARYPLEENAGGFNGINSVVTKRADYLAKLPGTEQFPWRVVVISSEDKELANNDMVYKLAAPVELKDISWIRPGKVAWDWWNDWNISGVDFRAGINTPTYKYYIDFAASNHLEYIIMDEGWSDDNDLNKINPDVNLSEIINYGNRKGVGVILWATWKSVIQQMQEVFPKYATMGIKGFKIDFLDRDDQKMVASTYQIAKKAADNKLIIDYHGMFKPSGLQRTYPNVLNFEGVKGMENVKWTPDDDVPRYDATIPFVRMLAGPMDYTPGAMRNATKTAFRPINSNPMSQGTRAHQLAMYVVFEGPLQMLADNPTAYMKEQESTNFIAAIPTVFDETIALAGKLGSYVAIARRKGDTWYIGALSNWEGAQLDLDLAFLGNGNYEAETFADGVNADRDARDYKRTLMAVDANSVMHVKMASGGGWAAIIKKKSE